ncbi:hypothetical protein ACQP2F_32365 [Actinoplanes sp. CA-030573]|uniref:hypothetical protein n=1 Tax=Actinoplanes sp. CA-030573 TaxID=3239898 RepID=UPI003D9119D7
MAIAVTLGQAFSGAGPAVAAPSQGVNAIPFYSSIMSAGASVDADSAQRDSPPARHIAVAGQTIGVEAGLVNETGSEQTVDVTMALWCWTAASAQREVSTPAVAVTVPGDPGLIKGATVLRRVRGTVQIPADCVHQKIFEQLSLPDGFTSVTTTQNGQGSASDNQFMLAGQLPGPGLPTAADGALVTLYRAVDAQEFDAIAGNGGRYALGPGQIGKYFYPTREQAQSLAQKYEQAGYGDYVVTSSQVDEGLLASGADSITVAGEGDAYFLLEEAVLGLGEVAIL